jgi:hypothetical protein
VTLKALVDGSGGTMAFRDIGDTKRHPKAPEPAASAVVPAPRALQLPARQLHTWQLTSFTGIVADTHSDEGRDVADPLLLPSEPIERPVVTHAFPAGRLAVSRC